MKRMKYKFLIGFIVIFITGAFAYTFSLGAGGKANNKPVEKDDNGSNDNISDISEEFNEDNTNKNNEDSTTDMVDEDNITDIVDEDDANNIVDIDREEITNSEKPNEDEQKDLIDSGENESKVDEPIETDEEDNENIEDDFSDAAFVGDSRTEGLFINTGLATAQFYTANGLMVDTAITKDAIRLDDGSKGNVIDALKQHDFKRVYIMFGVNELGWYSGTVFKNKYKELIHEIQKVQPDATIYIQSILPISEEKSKNDKIYNNKNVVKFNKWIKEVVEEEELIYLDVRSVIKDSTGALPKDASTDGVHLNKKYCKMWLKYLRENVKGD